MRIKPSYEELERNLIKLNKEAANYKKAEEKIKHLNLILSAIRNVNLLITKEKDRDSLLQRACDILVETRGYFNTWIVLFDDFGKILTAKDSGLSKLFAPFYNQMKYGKLTRCATKALNKFTVIVTKNPLSSCKDCPLSSMYGERAAMTAALVCREKVYGLLSASIPVHFSAEKVEIHLFKEVADDIAYALYTLKIEEKNKRAEKEIREHRDHLEKIVNKRTIELSRTNEQLQQEIYYRSKIAIQLDQSKRQFSSIIKSVPDIIYRLDIFGCITFISDSVKSYGYQPEELLGTYLLDLVHPEDKKEAAYKIEDRRTGDRSTRLFEVRLLTKDESIHRYKFFSLSSEGLYISDETKKDVFQGTQGIARDIADKKRAQEEQFKHEKLQGVLELAGTVCHELNQPFQIISGYAELMMMDKGINENSKFYTLIPKIKKQIDRMGQITQKLNQITEYKTKNYLEGTIIDLDLKLG